MIPSDEFSRYHAELLEGAYDCVDRLVLNAFFPLGQTGGGLRSWWRRLRGDDSTLDDAHLREMAGTFSRRLRAFCVQNAIPIAGRKPVNANTDWPGLICRHRLNSGACSRSSPARPRRQCGRCCGMLRARSPRSGIARPCAQAGRRPVAQTSVSKAPGRTRAPLDLKQMKTVFGRSYRPHNKVTRGRKPQEPVKTVEAPSYDLTVFKLKWGNRR